MTAQEQYPQITREQLIKMGADHFDALTEDDGWQDALEQYVFNGKNAPSLGDAQDKLPDGRDAMDVGMSIMQWVECNLVPDIVAEITRRFMLSAAQVAADHIAEPWELEGLDS